MGAEGGVSDLFRHASHDHFAMIIGGHPPGVNQARLAVRYRR
jgi:hypothetical protein